MKSVLRDGTRKSIRTLLSTHANRMKLLLQTLTLLLGLSLLISCAPNPTGLLRPNGVAVALDGTLYVMDRGNNRVVHLSATGQLLHTFGRLGAGPDDIYSGWDIALDKDGNIYICHQTRDEAGSTRSSDGVKVFTSEGRFWRMLGERVYTPADETNNTPYGLDIDEQGRVFVADFDAATIRVFSLEGQQLATFPGQSEQGETLFSDPVDVAVDDSRSLLYVTDPYHSQIHQFSLNTLKSGELRITPRQSFGSYGHEPGQFAYPQGLVVDDQSGRVYVSDMANRRIQVFDAEGQYLTGYTVSGNWQVIGLSLGPDGTVYAADALNNVIWVFGPASEPRRLEVGA
jgi:DNA-binding beta-propeller fold protein YncE